MPVERLPAERGRDTADLPALRLAPVQQEAGTRVNGDVVAGLHYDHSIIVADSRPR